MTVMRTVFDKRIELLVPRALEQLLGRDDRALGGEQRLEHGELLDRQVERATGPRGLAASGIEDDVAGR